MNGDANGREWTRMDANGREFLFAFIRVHSRPEKHALATALLYELKADR